MSNYLAIATVTAAIQRILQNAIAIDIPGAVVTTMRPDGQSGGGMPQAGINLYLYQITPNPAWRNMDLRTRRPKGDLIKQKLLGWDLYYILTFYGNERELEPQRLLGSAVRTFVDRPTLTPEILRDATNSASYPFLADSDLIDQSVMVKLIPSAITTEDLSRIWSVFFQIPYTLSLAYQATAVLIEGEKPGRRELPITAPQISVTAARPQIEELAKQTGDRLPVTLGPRSSYIDLSETLILRGKQLQGENTRVQIGEAQLTPQTVSDTEISLSLADLPETQTHRLRAGVQGVKVVRGATFSNTIPIGVRPTMTVDVVETITELEEDEDGRYSARVTVPVDVTVGEGQRVYLFLNSTTTATGYIFQKPRDDRDLGTIDFPIREVEPGEYLVRVQIDDAESPLKTEGDRFAYPILRLPSQGVNRRR
ncbi:MAG: DUF4255 domain-containing protein [Cyanobacteriota bacterium]|nr:DUF4255 domain-containing protein [Cyanobacteriota bacterium]